MARAVVLVGLLVTIGCAPARSKVVGRTGMVMAIAGVAGIIASAAASSSTAHAGDVMAGASAVSAAGILLYATHELSAPDTVYIKEDRASKHMRWARILTEHAAGAARDGNCAPVRKFEPRVRVYDSNYHDFVFMKDPEILRCLAPAPSGEPGNP